jgi:hypothetical protein
VSDAPEFRSEHTDLPASKLDPRVVNPYAAPTSVGAAPRGLKLPHPPRLSPEWTVLSGLGPYGAGLVLSVAGFWWSGDTPLATVTALVGMETTVYLGRTFWTGAGRAWMRTLVCLLPLAAIACAPALLHVLTGELWFPLRDVATFVLAFAGWSVLCLLVNALLFAIGSRDVPNRRTPPDRSVRRFVPLLIAAGILLGTSAAFAIRPQMVTIGGAGLGITTARLLIGGVILSSGLSLMTQTWRWGIRRWRRLAGCRLALFVLASLLSVAPLVAVAISYFFSDNPPPDAWTPFFAFLVVPIVREIFIRWAGYRTINVYVERRRARRNLALLKVSQGEHD